MSLPETVPQPGAKSDAPMLDPIIITLATGTLLGLIMIAQGNRSKDGFIHPMHSPNDRSRFVTIRALVDSGTYAVGSINEDGSYKTGSPLAEPGWDTIDKVRRPDTGLLYSSKPPLMPTVLAGEYWLIKTASGGRLSFEKHPLALVRIIVATTNLLPLVIFWILFSRLLPCLTANAWVHAYSLSAASIGTYLTGFSVTLNNHTVAACFGFFALYPAILIWRDGRREWWRFAVSGFFAAFTAVLELPAAALFAALLVGLGWKDLGRTIRCFLPLAAIPVAANFVTTYLATGGLSPAYAQKEWYPFEGSYWKIDPASGRLVGSSRDEKGTLVIGDPKGIDNQFEPAPIYLFHMLLGHHGIFSLSPIFVFSAIGLVRSLRVRAGWLGDVAILTAGLTIVLLVFYTFFAGARNYGGMCNGLRWLFWLIPLWLIFLPHGLGWKASCRGYRSLALLALVLSAAAAFYATRNPWTRPWLHELLNQAGWIQY